MSDCSNPSVARFAQTPRGFGGIMRRLWAGLLSLAVSVTAAVDWPTLELVPGGFFPPGQVVGAVSARDGSGRLFMVARDGRIWIWTGSEYRAEPFLNISAQTRVPQDNTESGLLGLAFDPDYASTGRFYVHYNRRSDRAGIVSRFVRSLEDPNRADPDSEEVLLVVPKATDMHNGGDLAFGPDGYLYISVGDDRSAAPAETHPSQQLDLLLGKILRIDVRAAPSNGLPYAIPPTNPFAGVAGARGEIWALGLRNPWRFSFDRESGDLYIADVGELSREEINLQRAGVGGGANYGWPIREGGLPYGGNADPDPAALTNPIFEYNRDLGRAVIGGYVHRGSAGRMEGLYFFADLVTRQVWALALDDGVWRAEVLGTVATQPFAFAEEEDGTLHLVTRAGLVRLGDTGHVHTPKLWPRIWDYSNPVEVEVSSLTPGAVLRYTLDGSVPDQDSAIVPESGVVIVDGGQSLRVVAFREGLITTYSESFGPSFRVAIPQLAVLARNPAYGHLVTVSCPTREVVFRGDRHAGRAFARGSVQPAGRHCLESRGAVVRG